MSAVIKISEADSKCEMDVELLKETDPSTSEGDSSKACGDVIKKVSPEEDLASSSSDATEMADDNCIKIVIISPLNFERII